MSETEPWISYNEKEIPKLLYKPFLIYGKQFLKFFMIALIPEFILFGLNQIAFIDISVESYIYGPVIELQLRFLETENGGEGIVTASVFILLFAFLAIMYRSAMISNITYKTVENGKANIFWAFDKSLRKTRDILLFTLFLLIIAAVPLIMVVLALIIQGSSFLYAYIFGWLIIIMAIVIPLTIYGRVSMFIAGMSKDNLHVGAAIQTSWHLSARENYYKTIIMFVLYATLGILLPWGLGLYITQIYTGIWVHFGMIFVRGLFYPLFDIAFTLTYMNLDEIAVERAVFSDSIREQRKKSKIRIENSSTE